MIALSSAQLPTEFNEDCPPASEFSSYTLIMALINAKNLAEVISFGKEIKKNFSKNKSSEVITLSTIEKESIKKIKAKLLSYAS